VRKLELAFVGCGAVADLHLSGIQTGASERVDVTAAVDPNPGAASRIAEKTGARTFRSLEEALEAGGFEAVDLMLPHALHEAAAIAAFDAGLHVLLEKPMSVTVESCERILAAARRAGTVFMVAENSHYWPEVTRARELIDAGAIGEVLTIRACANSPLLREPFYRGERPWRFDAAQTGGGICIDVAPHWIRPLRLLLGEVDEVVATLDRPVAEMEGESFVRALLRFYSGKVATFEAATLDQGILAPDAMFRITGTRGEIVIETTGGGRLVLYDERNRGGLPEEPRGYFASFGLEIDDFAAAVLEGKQLEAGPEWAVQDLRVSLAMVRSGASRRWEQV
jgi:UDP-N-acetyl-2-amino-2-deoxyglucuronate dehydrogenase